MAALAEVLAPDVELPSPLSRNLVFKGREDVLVLLGIVYATLRDVRWDAPVGEGSQQLAVAEARVAGFRLGDAMVFELDEKGRIARVRPHLRPLPATIAFALMLGPQIAPRPGVLMRAFRGGREKR